MTAPLISLAVSSPGFFGLNKQDSSGSLPMGWATTLDNVVFDENGRPAARKGKANFTSDVAAGTVKQIHEYVQDDGTRFLLDAGGNKIYNITSATHTDITGAFVAADDNWQFQNFNNNLYATQSGEPIISWAGTGNITDESTTYSGDDTAPSDNADTLLGAFGRLWTLDNDNQLVYSELLAPRFRSASGAGAFDLSTVWDDTGVALAEFNGFLVIFGRETIIIYQNAWLPDATAGDVDAMTLVETIKGVGCNARDSVQNVGNDVLFLSQFGVISLGRTIQEKSGPINDISKNNRDYLLAQVAKETDLSDIRSVYSPVDGFYLLSCPTAGVSFYFDLRARLEDGSFRMAEWSLAPKALAWAYGGTHAQGVYLENSTKTAKYNTYLDIAATYEVHYHGPWLDGGQEMANRIKIPKKLRFLATGGDGQTVEVRLFSDYNDVVPVFIRTDLVLGTANSTAWGVFTWGNSEWGFSLDLQDESVPTSGSGTVVMFGIKVPINGQSFGLDRIVFNSKIGREF